MELRLRLRNEASSPGDVPVGEACGGEVCSPATPGGSNAVPLAQDMASLSP